MSFLPDLPDLSAKDVAAIQGLTQVGGGFTSFFVSRRNAKELRRRAEAEAAQARREGGAIIAQARARRGASGIQVESGTSLDVTLALAEAFEMRALRTAYPFLAEASASEREGALDLIMASFEGASSLLGAGLRERQIAAGGAGVPPSKKPKPKPKRKLPGGVKKRQKLGVPTPEPFTRSIG